MPCSGRIRSLREDALQTSIEEAGGETGSSREKGPGEKGGSEEGAGAASGCQEYASEEGACGAENGERECRESRGHRGTGGALARVCR
jgi:hypothetical protein